MTQDEFLNWEEKVENKNTREFFETNLEYEKYLLDPKGEHIWLDITKDLELGNLEDWEHQTILNQEKTLTIKSKFSSLIRGFTIK